MNGKGKARRPDAAPGAGDLEHKEAAVAPGATRPQEPPLMAREVAWAALFLAGLLGVFFYDIVFLGRTLRVSNAISSTLPTGQYNYPEGFPPGAPVYDSTPGILEEPYQEFKERSLENGIFPLWNPHQAAGYPFLATLESSLLFIPEIVLYATPSPWSWDVYLLLRLWLAGLFTYAFVRSIGLSRFPAAVAGIAYMLSGPLVAYVTNVTTNADLLTPLLLLLVEWIVTRHRKRDAVFAALVVFQAVAAGHPEHTFFTLLTAFVYALFRLGQGAAARGPWRGASRLAIALVAGLGLSAVLLLPFGEYLFGHAWHVHGDRPGLGAIPARFAITMIFPGYFAQEPGSFHWNTWPGGWIGLLPFWLALSAFFARGTPRARIAFALLFTVYLLKVYGFPLVSLIGALPIFRLVKYPLHLTQAIALSAAVLCGAAVSALRDDDRQLRRFALAGVLILGASLAVFVVRPPTNAWPVAMGMPAALFCAASVAAGLRARGRIGRGTLSAAVALLLVIELFLLIPRTRSVRAEAWQVPPYVQRLRQDPLPFRVFGLRGCLYPDSATAFGLDDIGIYEGLFVDRFTTYIRELVDDRFFSPGSFHAFREDVRDPGSPFLDLLNLKYLIVPVGASIPPERQAALSLRPVYEGEVKIYERTRALPRVRIVHRAGVVSDGESALRALKSGYDARRGVIVEGEPGAKLAPVTASEDGSSVEAQVFGVNHKFIRVRMVHDGYLVVSDAYYPGWNATVDGRRAHLLRANYLFQAVQIPAGVHDVRIDFAPQSLRIGLGLSILTLVLLIAWVRTGHRERMDG